MHTPVLSPCMNAGFTFDTVASVSRLAVVGRWSCEPALDTTAYSIFDSLSMVCGSRSQPFGCAKVRAGAFMENAQFPNLFSLSFFVRSYCFASKLECEWTRETQSREVPKCARMERCCQGRECFVTVCWSFIADNVPHVFPNAFFLFVLERRNRKLE